MDSEMELKIQEIYNKKVEKYISEQSKQTIDDDDAIQPYIQLSEGNKALASETLVKYILKHNHIYTIESDRNPEMWIYINGVYVPLGETYIKKVSRLLLRELYTSHFVKRVIEKIQADTYINKKEFFKEPSTDLIAVENGILNITTGQLLAFTPELRFFNKIPVKYDPTATCPSIDKHLHTVLKFDEDVKVIYELFGFLLLRDYRYEKSFMFLGTGRNGKSKTLDLMKRFLGIENCANIPLQELERDLFSMSRLHKKLANLSGDLSKQALKNTGYWKSLTGRDLISANRKNKERIDFVNYAKMVFATNELPATYDLSIAFFDRWIIIEFPYTFVTQHQFKEAKDKTNLKLSDPRIIEKISTPKELSGLLNKAIEGFKKLTENGGFSFSKNTEEVKKMWIRKSNSFSAFVMDCVEKADWDDKIEKSTLRQRYIEYCRQHKLKIVSDKMIKFTLMRSPEFDFTVDELYCDDGSGMRKWHWRGIKLKQKNLLSYGESLENKILNFIPEFKMINNRSVPTFVFMREFEKYDAERIIEALEILKSEGKIMEIKKGEWDRI